MAKIRFIRNKITSLARVIATPIPIYTVTRNGDTVVKERYADNGVQVLASQTEEFWVTRDGAYLHLVCAQDTGPRGEKHVRRTVEVLSEEDFLKAVPILVVGQAVLGLIRRRRENAEARTKTLEDAERDLSAHLDAPVIVPCNTPLPAVLAHAEES